MKNVQGVSKASSLYARLPLHFRRMFRVGILLFADSLCLVAAFYISLNLRFDWRVPPFVTQELLRYLHWFLLTYLGTMLVFRQYRLLWRYATGRELLIQAVILLLAGGLTLLINGVFAWGASRAVLVGACLFTIGLVTANRLFARSVRSRMNYLEAVTKHPDGRKSLPVMIVGAGEAASFILTQNRRAGSQYGQVLALVDDAPEKQNMRVQNVPVMGRIKDVPALVTHEQLRPHLCAGYGRAGPHHETGEKLIRFYGFDPQEDMPIQITGLRPGEKLYEELMLDEEQSQMESTNHEKIMVAPPLNRDPKEVEAALTELKRSITAGSDAVESALLKMLPNFHHMCNMQEEEPAQAAEPELEAEAVPESLATSQGP